MDKATRTVSALTIFFRLTLVAHHREEAGAETDQDRDEHDEN